MGESLAAHDGLVAAGLTHMNLADPIDEAIALVPSRIALVVDDDEITFAALGDAIDHVSSALVGAGVAPGDRVALVASSGLLATATVLACARIGAAAAPMSARATSNEIEVMARERVELLATARVNCAISTPKLALNEGAFFEGDCRMPQRMAA